MWRNETEQRCRRAGVVFQPMIFESLGGVSGEAERVVKSLNKAVAENTDTSESEVATFFWQRLSIDIQRSARRAFSRRVRQCGGGSGGLGAPDWDLGGILGIPQGV